MMIPLRRGIIMFNLSADSNFIAGPQRGDQSLQCFIWGMPYISGIRNPDIEHGLGSTDYVMSLFLYWVPGVVLLCMADSVVKLAYSDSNVADSSHGEN